MRFSTYYRVYGHFRFLQKIAEIFKIEDKSSVSTTPAANEKKFVTGIFFMFCRDAVYTYVIILILYDHFEVHVS
jgi:hypothetical protein